MAHEIEQFTDGSAAFVSARKDAWHKLGTTLGDVFTAEQAMSVAKLGGWNVRKVGLTASEITDDGVTSFEVPDHYATVRSNPVSGRTEYLGTVGQGYTPVQNEEHCELLNTLVDESGAHFETAGSLRGGRQVFVTMKLPEHIRIADTDDMELYIAGLNSHDGSTAFRLVVSPVRIVCANTQRAALSTAKASYSIRHTSGASGRIQEAREVLGMTWTYMSEFQAEAERMMNETLTNTEFDKIVGRVFELDASPASKRAGTRQAEVASDLRYLFRDADTQQAVRGTRYAAYQAVVEYADHYAPVRTKGDLIAARAERALTGGVDQVKQRAFNLLKVG